VSRERGGALSETVATVHQKLFRFDLYNTQIIETTLFTVTFLLFIDDDTDRTNHVECCWVRWRLSCCGRDCCSCVRSPIRPPGVTNCRRCQEERLLTVDVLTYNLAFDTNGLIVTTSVHRLTLTGRTLPFRAIADSAALRQRGSGLATRARDRLQLTTQSLFLWWLGKAFRICLCRAHLGRDKLTAFAYTHDRPCV